MNILLVQLPSTSTTFVPVGISYLKAFLSQKYNVSAIDLNALYYHHEREIYYKLSSISYYAHSEIYHQLIDSVVYKNYPSKLLSQLSIHLQNLAFYTAKKLKENYEFDIIGFSVNDASVILTMAVAHELKKLSPDSYIILGGQTFCNISSLKVIEGFEDMNFWDAVVFGEGEETLFELAEKFERGEKTETKGALVRTGKELVYGGSREEIEIENLPYPDFSDFSFKLYLNPMALPIVSSRGCIGGCSFCRERLFWRKYRRRKPENVISEIEERISTYGFRSFVFCESLINGDINWLKDFSRLLIKKDMDIIWESNARIMPAMDKKFLDLLRASGCVRLKYGVESGSPAVLKDIRKGIRTDLTCSVIKKTYKAGINPHAYMMTNVPKETYNDTLKTLKLILRNINFIGGVTFHPYHEAIEHRALRNDYKADERTLFRPNILQFLNFIYYISPSKGFYQNLFELLVKIYSSISQFDCLIDLSASEITENKLKAIKGKSLYANICLDKKSITTAIDNLKKINPEKLALCLSWNNNLSVKSDIIKFINEIKTSGLSYQIIKPVLPCLYGKRRLSPCKICFQFANLTGQEIEKILLSNKRKVLYKEFYYEFCKSRISAQCSECKDFKYGRCIGVCNNPKVEELNIKFDFITDKKEHINSSITCE